MSRGVGQFANRDVGHRTYHFRELVQEEEFGCKPTVVAGCYYDSLVRVELVHLDPIKGRWKIIRINRLVGDFFLFGVSLFFGVVKFHIFIVVFDIINVG